MNDIGAETEALLAPIAGDNPAGEDLSLSTVFDQIKESRRADAVLAQGDWKTALKVADWPKVQRLARDVLTKQSKDLQVAAWLTEAWTQTEGLKGLARGCALAQGLIDRFWDQLHPMPDGEDLEQRAGRLEWLNRPVSAAILEIPLVAKDQGLHGLRSWNEAREVENLARRDAESAQAAMNDGKTNPEVLAKAIAGTPKSFYEGLVADADAARAAFAAMETSIVERFGAKQAPGLGDLRKALEDCSDVIAQIARDKGVAVSNAGAEPAPDAPAAPAGVTAAAPVAMGGPSGPIASRAEALRRLDEIANYFRATEPHSPVAYLVQRAVKWGHMPLEKWLDEVIKDAAALATVKETLGVQDQPAEN